MRKSRFIWQVSLAMAEHHLQIGSDGVLDTKSPHSAM
jgi:hypothetical protein